MAHVMLKADVALAGRALMERADQRIPHTNDMPLARIDLIRGKPPSYRRTIGAVQSAEFSVLALCRFRNFDFPVFCFCHSVRLMHH